MNSFIFILTFFPFGIAKILYFKAGDHKQTVE